MTTKSIDRDTLRNIKARLQEKLNEMEAEFGINFKVNRSTFSAGACDLQVNGSLDLPLEETAHGRTFMALAPRYGLRREDLGRKFYFNGEAFRITGLKTSRPVYPIEGERVSDGRPYKFTVAQLKSVMVAS